jgi:hypothetical protein
MVSLDGGGGLMPCHYEASEASGCKFFEEYMCSPDWVDNELEVFRRNYYSGEPTEEEVEDYRTQLVKQYNNRMKDVHK